MLVHKDSISFGLHKYKELRSDELEVYIDSPQADGRPIARCLYIYTQHDNSLDSN